jgi:hypothetical protein
VLVIRPPQWDVFSAEHRRKFVDRVLATIQECWPRTYAARGEPALRVLIEKCVAEAEGMGIVTARDCARYVNLVIALGDDFLGQPRFAWAAHLLGKQDLVPATRLDLVFDRVKALGRAGAI